MLKYKYIVVISYIVQNKIRYMTWEEIQAQIEQINENQQTLILDGDIDEATLRSCFLKIRDEGFHFNLRNLEIRNNSVIQNIPNSFLRIVDNLNTLKINNTSLITINPHFFRRISNSSNFSRLEISNNDFDDITVGFIDALGQNNSNIQVIYNQTIPELDDELRIPHGTTSDELEKHMIEDKLEAIFSDQEEARRILDFIHDLSHEQDLLYGDVSDRFNKASQKFILYEFIARYPRYNDPEMRDIFDNIVIQKLQFFYETSQKINEYKQEYDHISENIEALDFEIANFKDLNESLDSINVDTLVSINGESQASDLLKQIVDVLKEIGTKYPDLDLNEDSSIQEVIEGLDHKRSKLISERDQLRSKSHNLEAEFLSEFSLIGTKLGHCKTPIVDFMMNKIVEEAKGNEEDLSPLKKAMLKREAIYEHIKKNMLPLIKSEFPRNSNGEGIELANSLVDLLLDPDISKFMNPYFNEFDLVKLESKSQFKHLFTTNFIMKSQPLINKFIELFSKKDENGEMIVKNGKYELDYTNIRLIQEDYFQEIGVQTEFYKAITAFKTDIRDIEEDFESQEEVNLDIAVIFDKDLDDTYFEIKKKCIDNLTVELINSDPALHSEIIEKAKQNFINIEIKNLAKPHRTNKDLNSFHHFTVSQAVRSKSAPSTPTGNKTNLPFKNDGSHRNLKRRSSM